MIVTKKMREKAWELQDQLAVRARANYIQKVMKWEECDYEEAYLICIGKTDPVEPEYSLGYKMCDPIYLMAMNAQLRKKDRDAAREKFKEMLEPDELKIFEEQVEKMDTRQMWKDEKKRQKVKE